MSGKGKKGNGHGGTATLTRLVITMQNGVCYDAQHHPRNVSIRSSGDDIRINNHGGTVIVGGQILAAYVSVEVSAGTRISINGQTGRVIRV